MAAKQCFYNNDGHMKQFYCGYSQKCCEQDCCTPQTSSFYTHWYFWVAVAVLLLFLVAAAVSGYCRLRSDPPYRLLGVLPGQTQTALLPWIWSLDEEGGSSGVNSPQACQNKFPRPYLYSLSRDNGQTSPCLQHPPLPPEVTDQPKHPRPLELGRGSDSSVTSCA